jgi:vanillate O-demethylase ferredoxin subunit
MYNVKLARRMQEARDIVSLELVDPDGLPFAAFEAGAHVDVEIKPGLVRQYSLCNVPGETHRYVIAVLREPDGRGGSMAVHDSLREGTMLRISEPKNHFRLEPGAARSLLFAGGIGITPMLAMAQILAAGQCPFELHYSARSRGQAAFVKQLEQSRFADSVRFHFSEGTDAHRLDMPSAVGALEEGTHLYVCGPRRFTDALMATARDHGFPLDGIRPRDCQRPRRRRHKALV